MKNNSELNLLLAKKTEKVVTAVYLISQFLNDTEDLKLELRSTGNLLLKEINLIAYNNSKDLFSLYKDSLDYVSLLILYINLAKNSNLISTMNCEIVIQALRSVEHVLIEEQFRFDKQDISIVEEDFFFNLERESFKNNFPNPNTSFDVLTNRNLNSKNNKQYHSNDSTDKRHLENLNDISFVKDIKTNFKVATKKVINSKSESKNKRNIGYRQNRKEQILGVFSRGVEVSIKDISKKIIGCSLKTLQREINNLLEDGKIEKIGEKRWSRYKLIS